MNANKHINGDARMRQAVHKGKGRDVGQGGVAARDQDNESGTETKTGKGQAGGVNDIREQNTELICAHETGVASQA